MATNKCAAVPSNGERITYENGLLGVPNNPIIPFVEGDRTGADRWRASVRVSIDAGRLIVRGLENAIKSRHVTYDLARQMSGATEVATTGFADQIIKGMSA